MSVRFVIGRSGSGKTRFCQDRVVELLQSDPLAQNIIWIVPQQATFTTQRHLATDPRVDGFINTRISSLEQLADDAIEQTHLNAGAQIDATGRCLILSHLLRENQSKLSYFARSATQPTLAAEIDGAFSEFERAGRDLSEIDTILTDLDPANPQHGAIHQKLSDLKLLHIAYTEYLTSHDLQPNRRLELIPQAFSNWSILRNAEVFIDEHDDFSPIERLMIASIAQSCKALYITLNFDTTSPLLANVHAMPSEMGLFFRGESAYRKLWFIFKESGLIIEPPVLLKQPRRFNNPTLAGIEQALTDTMLSVKTSQGIRLEQVDDTRSEVDAAAREILRLTASGLRMRDICVLVRSISDYHDIFDSGFKAHQIPYFIDQRRSAAHHPLIRALQSIGQIVLSRWDHEAAIALAKTGLARLQPDMTDLLEDYVQQHHIRAEAWLRDEPWGFLRNQHDEDEFVEDSAFSKADLIKVNHARTLLRDALGNVGEAAWATTQLTTQERVRDLFSVLSRMHVRVELMSRMQRAENSGKIQERDEHEQVWQRIIDLFDQITDLLGTQPMSAIDFFGMMNTALSSFDLAITPPTLDQVLVGSIDRTHANEIKAVILLGMNEGQFPLCPGDVSVLNDRDRELLEAKGIEIDPPTQRILLNERFMGYKALTRSSDHVTLIRSTTTSDGNLAEPSIFWTTLQKAFVNIPIHQATTGPAKLSTAPQVTAQLLGWAKGRTDITASDGMAGLYDWFARSKDEQIQWIKSLAWGALSYGNVAELSPELAKRLFSSPLAGSASRLECFSACSFKHYAQYGLNLQDRQETDISSMDLGNVYHSVLEKLISKTIQTKIDFANTDSYTPEHIHQIAGEIGQELRDQIMLSSARNRYMLDHIERTISRILRTQQECAKVGYFRPKYTELSFGRRDDSLPAVKITTPKGNELKLFGQIDRVDVAETQKLFTVIDYKLSSKKLSINKIYHRLTLQLLTYIIILESSSSPLKADQYKPAAAFFAQLARTLDKVDSPENEPDENSSAFAIKTKPRGMIDDEYAKWLDTTIEIKNSSDVYSFKRNKDGSLAKTKHDGLSHEDFVTLVNYLSRILGQLTDEILSGDIRVRPYMLGKETPCKYCQFGSVCRFDVTTNQYKRLNTPQGNLIQLMREDA